MSGADDNEFATPHEEVLRRAAALVFVEDLELPQPDDADLHHLGAVLRLKSGDEVVCCDGSGGWRLALVSAHASSDTARGRSAKGRHGAIGLSDFGAIERSEPARPQLAVGFALQKGDRSEWTVQKLTELGIDVIAPFVSERTVVRMDPDALHRKGERLRRVAREAASQSRRPVLPDVADPTPFSSLPARLLAEGLLAEPGGAPLPLDATTVLVGPEGGWSQGELELARGTVSLGSGVLRAETAAMAAAVLLGARRAGLVR